jgi:hypothetical protein
MYEADRAPGSGNFWECHDSYAAAPYRIFKKLPPGMLTTLSF